MFRRAVRNLGFELLGATHVALACRYARDLLPEAGRRALVGGQEGMIIDSALGLFRLPRNVL